MLGQSFVHSVSKLVFYAQSTGAVISGRSVIQNWKQQPTNKKGFLYCKHKQKSVCLKKIFSFWTLLSVATDAAWFTNDYGWWAQCPVPWIRQKIWCGGGKEVRSHVYPSDVLRLKSERRMLFWQYSVEIPPTICKPGGTTILWWLV